MNDNPQNHIIHPIIKTAILAVLLIGIVFVITNRLIFTTSDQAFINGRATVLRADIDGNASLKNLKVGDTVSQGQPLMVIKNKRNSNNNLLTEIYHLRSSILADHNAMKRAQVKYRDIASSCSRKERLRGTGAVAEIELEQCTYEKQSLREEIHSKRRGIRHYVSLVHTIKQKLAALETSVIESPCDGVIWSILIDDGEHLDVNDELIRIISQENIWIDAFFNEKSASRLAPGAEVIIEDITTRRQWTGRIIYIRGGSGRVNYSSAVEVPPSTISQRLIAARIKVDWQGAFSAGEFFGIGRSMIVKYRHQ